MILLTRAEVERLLDVDALIGALAVALADVSAGRASVPDRIAALVPERDGLLGAMPGYIPSSGALAAKLVSLFPRNAGGSLPTHQAVIVTFDPETGEPAALIDGTSITGIRTGATSALSARLLAREDSSVLAIVGTGVQARSHALALPRVRPIREIRVAGRDFAKAQALADELSERDSGVSESSATPSFARAAGVTASKIDVTAFASIERALDGADIVCVTTHSVEPVIRREWLRPGMHVTSVGYNTRGREVDDRTIADSLVFVESRRAALAPAPAGTPDLIEPIERGVIGRDHIRAELGELVSGTKPGRTTDQQLTLYKSVGISAEDAAAAALVLAAAREQGVGVEIRL